MWLKWTKLFVLFPAVVLLMGSFSPPHARAQADGPNAILTSQGVGPIVIGATIDELVELGNFDILTEVNGDVTQYAVKADGQVLAYVETSDDATARIDRVVVTNPLVRTAEGIGPQSEIRAAEAAYGTAILAISPTSGRESLSVSSGPPNLQFFTSEKGQPRAGRYTNGTTATTDYRPEAVITSIVIDCRERTCSKPRPQPTSSEPPQALATTGPSTIAAMVGLTILGLGLLAVGGRNLLALADQETRERERSAAPLK